MASDAPTKCSLVVESKPSALPAVCQRILGVLEEKRYSQGDIFAVHLALEEAFHNAVEHGNKMDPTKTVRISCSVDDNKAEISLQDQGPGFDPDSVPDPRFGKNLLKPSGRGLLLINAYMDVVKFDSQGNSVQMVRYKERPSLDHPPDPAEA